MLITMRNYADRGWMGDSPALPQLAEVLFCAKCGAKLRSTNIDYFTDELGRPLCDPHGHALEAKQEMHPVCPTPPEPPRPRKKVARSKSAIRAEQLSWMRLIDDAGGMAAREVIVATNISRSTIRSGLLTLFRLGWLDREPTDSGGPRGVFIYTVSNKGKKEMGRGN